MGHIPNILACYLQTDANPAYLFEADPDFYLMRMRIRIRIPVTKMMWIYVDPDPQHWIIYMIVIILNPPHLKSLLQKNRLSILTVEYGIIYI
jgi:hypothetical protein